MLNRAIRAALLRGGLYHELTDEPEEIFYALAVVVLSGIALGAGIQYAPLPKWEGAGVWLFVFFSVWARVVGWFLWAGIAYVVGTKAFGGQAGYRRLLRSIGLTYAPGVLAFFGGIPVVGPFLLGLSFLWIFPAALVAIRETQGLNWVQAIICAILGWSVSVFLLIVIFQFTRVNA